VKYWLHRCIICTRWRRIMPQSPMGNLPQGCIKLARPFLKIGIDYASSILMRTSWGRGHRSHKAFIAIFVCLCSTHFEVISDYSTDAFLVAFRLKDSARMFIPIAAPTLRTSTSSYESFSEHHPSKIIANAAASEGIRWFNPSFVPLWGPLGDCYKSTKNHLR